VNNAIVIGYGSIGKRHVENLCRLGCNVEVVSKHGQSEYVGYECINDVSNWAKYNYVVIASETHLHAQQLLQIDALVESAKILVEKPICICKTQLDLSSRNSVFVGYNLRYHSVIERLVAIVKDQTVVMLTIHAGQYLPQWRPGSDYRKCYSAFPERGGGVLLDLSHEIDYMHHLVGSVAVVGAVNRHVSQLVIESEDVCSFIGCSEGGAMVTCTLDYLSRQPVRQILLTTNEETVCANLISGEIVRTGEKREIEFCSHTERNYTYYEMHKDILVNPKPKACTLQEGLNVMDTIDCIQKTANAWRT
jgi:CMP-N,N'-diacetyllegionaminic acid synthase